MGERSAAHLVRHLVSAQPVILVTAEAGLYIPIDKVGRQNEQQVFKSPEPTCKLVL